MDVNCRQQSTTRRGLTLVEAVIVLVILLLLAAVLFPVLGLPLFGRRGHGYGARQTTCQNNMRQLSVAIQMYCQDNNQTMPAANWVPLLAATYGPLTNILVCPSDPGVKKAYLPVSYGYNSQLVDATGKGISFTQIGNPTGVALLADAAPTSNQTTCGILGNARINASVPPPQTVQPDFRHNKGMNMAFCDGHVSYETTGIDDRLLNNAPARSLYHAARLGWVDNPAGGIGEFNLPVCRPSSFSIGGDYCLRPLLAAAAQLWMAKTGAVYVSRGFHGQYAVHGRTADYAWGHGDGLQPAGNAVAVGKDAVVVIVAKNTSLNLQVLPRRSGSSALPSVAYNIARSDLATLFSGKQNPACRVFTFDKTSGTRKFFQRELLGGAPIGSPARTVKDDLEMVNKVAADHHGIGYCSSFFVDIEKVNIVAIDGKAFSSQDPLNPLRVPTRAVDTGYPYIRTLWVSLGGAAWQNTGGSFGNLMLAPNSPGMQAIRQGPLFTAGYFAQ